MLKWLGQTKAQAVVYTDQEPTNDGDVTDDPLAAAIDPNNKIYSVSRINPLFVDSLDSTDIHIHDIAVQEPVLHAKKSNSSGYGGSYGSDRYSDQLQLRQIAVAVLENNPEKPNSSLGSTPASTTPSSSSGTLNAITEGVPVPIWPDEEGVWCNKHDSLVDDTLLMYTSFSYKPEKERTREKLNQKLVSVKDILVDLLEGINETIQGKLKSTPEEMLKQVNERIALSIEALKLTTDEEVKNLCINLSNCRKSNSAIRAFADGSNSSSSGCSPGRSRTSSDAEESDFRIRNALIYGTLYRGGDGGCAKGSRRGPAKKGLLLRPTDERPSVWEQYYGIRSVPEDAAKGEIQIKFTAKPTDVPLFPGGRPEADFTLDVPRSELLSKRMEEDKKWRCRCRLLTSFLGLVFFLLSVMAVSLVLTRGKRMFGSMV